MEGVMIILESDWHMSCQTGNNRCLGSLGFGENFNTLKFSILQRFRYWHR